MMTAAERDRLQALARGIYLTPKPVLISLFCDRCGAEFIGDTLCPECPHCNVIGVTA